MNAARVGLVAFALAACQPKEGSRGSITPEALVRDVERGKLTPRDERARAYAAALVALGNAEKARAVLLADYRHGAHLKSLVELARLERSLGLDGSAALHEARVATLAPRLLHGRKDVCEAFRDRARRFDELGDPRAVLDDLQRARSICPSDFLPSDQVASDRRLAARANRRLKDLRRRQREARTASSNRLEEKPKEPLQTRRWSARHHASLPADEVVRMLAAELRGELGPDLVVADELRMWVGEAEWNDFEPALTSLAAAESAYARFRLGKVVPVPIQGDPTMMVERRQDTETSRALESVDESPLHRGGAWRIFVIEGDLGAAELTLTTFMRETSREGAPAGDAAARDESASSDPIQGIALDHWVAFLPSDPDVLANVLILARFRRAAGQEDLALRLTLWTLAQARKGGVDRLRDLGLVEARRHLALGRPWHAIAVAEAVRRTDAAVIRSAAATAIELCRAVGSPCGLHGDEEVVTRVLGDAWVRERRQELHDWALVLGRSDRDACPIEAFGEDTSTPLGRVFRLGTDAHSARATDDLRIAIESDLSLVCGGRWILPILAVERRAPTAGSLVETWAHSAGVSSYAQLEILGQAALIAGRNRQAHAWLRRAAALAAEPALLWSRTASLARTLGDADFEIRALREALLHHRDFDDDPIRLQLLAAELRRMQGSWPAKNTEVGVDSLRMQVQEYLDGGPARERWWRREQLASLLGEDWVEPELERSLAAVLWPTPLERARHPGHGASEGGRGVHEGPPRVLDLAWIEAVARHRGMDAIPAAIESFAPVERLDELRLALIEHAPSAETRFAMGSAVAAHGDAAARQAAVGRILDWVRRRQTAYQAVAAWVVRGPAALPSAGWSLEPTLTDRDAVGRMAAGLPLDPSALKR